MPFSEDFDFTVYVKGDKKPVTLWDAQVMVEYAVDDPLDFGDAPEPYATLTAAGGAFHHVTTDLDGDTAGMPQLVLGTLVDAELDGLPEAEALGDDAFGFEDDEDGVLFDGPLVPGRRAKVSLETTTSLGFGGMPYLNAWVDFDLDGTWEEEEQILADYVLDGKITEKFDVPPGAVTGWSYARFRLSSVPGLGPTGEALDGEVEDHMVEIISAGFHDLVARNELGDLEVALSTGVSFATSTAARDAFPPALFVDLRSGDFPTFSPGFPSCSEGAPPPRRCRG